MLLMNFFSPIIKSNVLRLIAGISLFSSLASKAVAVAADSDWQPHNYTSLDGGEVISSLVMEENGGFSISGDQTAGHGGIGVTYTTPIELQVKGFCLEFSLDQFPEHSEDKWFAVMFLDRENITNSANNTPVCRHWDDNAILAAEGAGLVILLRPTGDGILEVETRYVGVASASDATRTDGQWVHTGDGAYTSIKLQSYEHIKLCLLRRLEGGFNIELNGGDFKRGDGAERADGDEGSINPHNKHVLLERIFPLGTPGYVKMAAKSVTRAPMKFTIHEFDGSPAYSKIEKEQAAVQGVYELFKDTKFANGFNVSGLSSKTDGHSIKARFDYGDATRRPNWRVAQFDTKYSFADMEKTHFSEMHPGIYKIVNPSKEITLDTNTGELGLKLLSSTVYEKPREYGERWPHLLIEDFGMYADSKNKFAYKLKNISQLRFHVKQKLTYFDDRMGNTANQENHAAMFFAYLYVTGTNNKGVSERIWFGFPLFDNRYAFSDEYGKKDGGKDDASDFFIYNIPSRAFTNTTFHNAEGVPVGSVDNPWMNIDIDVMPHIQRALEAAQSKGFMQGVKMEDLYINGMNMGWEHPGTYDTEMVIKDLSLKSYVK